MTDEDDVGSEPGQHPARYSRELIPTLAGLLAGRKRILDFMAGTGERLAEFRDHGLEPDAHLTTLEIEDPWATTPVPGIDRRVRGDACAMPFESEEFDAVVWSPSYGNRMGDKQRVRSKNPKTGKPWKYVTYTHRLGRRLHPNNSGGMQWHPGPRGEPYRDIHRRAYPEAWRALAEGGLAVFNCKDHWRTLRADLGSELMPVTLWHLDTLCACGFEVVSHQIRIKTPGMRCGENREKREDGESVVMLWKPPRPGAPVPAEIRATAQRVALLTEASELEGLAAKYMRDDAMTAYRQHLEARERAREGLVSAWRAGFRPEDFDAFEGYRDDPAAWRKLTPRKASRQSGGDVEEVLAAVILATEATEYRRALADTHEAEAALLEILRPWLSPAFGISDFAGQPDEATQALLDEAREKRSIVEALS